MRTEALVYLVVATFVMLVVRLARRDSLVRVGLLGASVGVGATIVLVANQLLEGLVLGSSVRAGRAAGTARGVASGLSGRVGEAFTTTFGLNGLRPPLDVVAGCAVVALVGVGIGVLAYGAAARRPLGVGALAVATVIVVARSTDGLGFVPGFLVASPFAVVGLVYGWREHRAWYPAFIAVGALPIVWLFQYQGGARPQWGGRYVLLSGAVLAVVGVVVLRRRRGALLATLALALVVTACGLAWLSQRSHAVADGMERLVARHDQAVVSTDAHLLREGGAFYDPDRHWLTAVSDADLRLAAGTVRRAGDRELAVIGEAGQRLPQTLAGYTRRESQPLEILPGRPLVVVTYRLS